MMVGMMVLCASIANAGPSLKVNRVEPGPVPLYGVDRIAVVPFEGPAGLELAEGLRRAFNQPDRGRTNAKMPYLQEGFRTDPFQVVSDGPDATLAGYTRIEHRVEEGTAREKQRDSRGNVVKDADGKAVYITVPCLERIVIAHIDWRVTRTNGDQIAVGEQRERATDRRCGDKRNRLRDRTTLTRAAVSAAPSAIVGQFLPLWTVHQVDMEKNKDTKDMVKVAKKGDWDTAMCMFRGQVDNGSTNPDMHFNLASIYEARGWYEEAETLFEAAVNLDDKRKYRRGVEGIQRRISAVRAMDQGYSAVSYEPLQKPQSDICAAM